MSAAIDPDAGRDQLDREADRYEASQATRLTPARDLIAEGDDHR